MIMAYVLVALVGAAITLFAVQNNTPVVVRFIGWRVEEPVSLVVLLSVLAGAVLTAALGVVRYWRLRSRIRQLENQLARAQVPAAQSVGPDPGRDEVRQRD